MEFGSYWPYPLVMIIVKSFDPSFGVKKGSDSIPNWNKIHYYKDIIPIKTCVNLWGTSAGAKKNNNEPQQNIF